MKIRAKEMGIFQGSRFRVTDPPKEVPDDTVIRSWMEVVEPPKEAKQPATKKAKKPRAAPKADE